jgi:hypothetical protein
MAPIFKLMVDAVDMRGRPLTERRSLLEELVYAPREGLSLSEAYDGRAMSCSAMPAALSRRHRFQAAVLPLSFRPLG